MQKIIKWINGECSGWKKAEVIWFSFCVFATIAGSCYLQDNLIGITTAVTGIFYTLLAGKGKISCYGFGIVNSFLYGLVSFEERLYGEVMLNWGWYFPMMFAGIFFWGKNLDSQKIIKKTTLSPKERGVYYSCSAAAIIVYSVFLYYLNDSQPITDSITTILSVTAMILTVRRCADQWILWTIVNVVSILMWFRAFRLDGESVAILFMWIVALANGIIFYFQWYKDIHNARQVNSNTR